MTTAHLFYIPVILFVGLLAGYFLGQRAAEQSLKERRKKLARRRAMKKKKREASGEAADEEVSGDSDRRAVSAES